MNNYYGSSNLDYAYYLRLIKSAVSSSYKTVLLMSVLVGIATFLYSLTFKPQYRAITVMHVAPSETAVFDLRSILFKQRDPTFRDTQIGIIRSRTLMNNTVTKLGLVNRIGFTPQKKTVLNVLKEKLGIVTKPADDRTQEIVENLRELVSVSEENKSNLLNISIALPDPKLAAEITNSLAEEYINTVEESKRLSTETAESWLLERLDVVNNDLKKAEQALQEFKEREDIIGSSQQNDGFATQEVDIITGRLLEARQKRISSESLYQQITSTKTSNLQGITAIQNDAIVQNIRTELVQLERREGELSQRYGPKHRRIIELRSQIKSTNENLERQVQRVVSSVKSEYELAKESESYLNSLLGRSTNKVQSLGRKQFNLLSLEQDVRTQRDVYQAFLKRLNESKGTGVSVNENVRITDRALVPHKPLPSKGILFVFLFSFLTLILGFGVALLRELFDNSINNDEDVKNKLSEISLGSVPEIDNSEDNKNEGLFNIAYRFFYENKTSQFSEAIRTIRSSLMLSSIDNKKRRILFTSTTPAEGKTSMSISSAIAFGQVQKTLLIDCDLRRPSLDSLLGKTFERRALGLSDLCSGSAKSSDCIYKLDNYGIDLLPAGTVNPNPQELFCSTKFSELLNKLNEIYDVIVIDSPPCAGLSDALLLSTHVDQMAYVVKAGVTPVAKVRSVIQSMKKANAPFTGVIVNQVPTSDFSYNYYYGNGYYSEEQETKSA